MTRTLIIILASLILVGCGGTSTKTYYSSWTENIYGAQLQIIQNNQSYKVTFQETTDNPDEVDKIRKRSLSKCIT